MEYKPCPFCGSTNTIFASGAGDDWWVACINCQAIGPIADNFADADKYWNEREQPPKPKEP